MGVKLIVQDAECRSTIDASRVSIVIDAPRAVSWTAAELATRVYPLTTQEEIECPWTGDLEVEPMFPRSSEKASGLCPLCGTAIVVDRDRAMAVGGTVQQRAAGEPW